MNNNIRRAALGAILLIAALTSAVATGLAFA